MICCGGDALFASQQLAPLSQLCVAALGSVESGSLWDRDDSEGSSHFSRTGNLESSCTWKVVIISLDQTRTFTPWHCLTTLVKIIEFFQNGVIILVDQKNGSISEHSHPIIVGEFPKQLYFAKCFRRFQMIWTTPSYIAFYMAMPLCYIEKLYFYEQIIFLILTHWQLLGSHVWGMKCWSPCWYFCSGFSPREPWVYLKLMWERWHSKLLVDFISGQGLAICSC